MKKLDRLVWTSGISFLSYGVRVGVRANRPEALELIREYLPPGSKMSASPVVERLYSFVFGGDIHETMYVVFTCFMQARRRSRGRLISNSFWSLLNRTRSSTSPKMHLAKCLYTRAWLAGGDKRS